MATFILYGASDDLIEADGAINADEFNGERFEADLVQAPDAQLHVSCWYAANGCWHVGVGQADEDVEIPEHAGWSIRIGQEQRGYSAVLTVEAPGPLRLDNILIDGKPLSDS